MQDQNETTPITERKVFRRGLIAGIAGLGAAAVLKVTGASKAEAADGANLVLGSGGANGSTTQTLWTIAANSTTGFQIVRNAANVGSFNTAMQIMSDQGAGIVVFTASSASNFPAVRGENNTSNGIGVMGVSTGGSGQGVRGAGSANGTGVTGVSNSTNGDNSGQGTGFGMGVHGLSATGVGVQGDAAGGVGVRGFATLSVGSGVGDGMGVSVHGRSGTGLGVLGEVNTAPGVGVFPIGVKGVSGINSTGVKGVSNTGNNLANDGTGSGIGVQGKSGSGDGVNGVSTSGAGIRGNSTNFVGAVGLSTNSHGLYGFSAGLNGVALVGDNQGGGLAGLFQGSVQITGGLQVGGAKNAVIKMRDGTSALVYCQESPEPYFEDFGMAQLSRGVAQVAIEPDFATLVAGGTYMVFLTPEGDTPGLFVARKGPQGFEVREVGGGVSNVTFSYRVVTKRKDIDGKRFARVNNIGAQTISAVRASLGLNDTGGTGLPPLQTPPVVGGGQPTAPYNPGPSNPGPVNPTTPQSPGPGGMGPTGN